MSKQDIIRKLLGLQDVIATKIEETEKEIEIHIELEAKEHRCPCCCADTKHIHDYRIQRVADSPYRSKALTLVYKILKRNAYGYRRFDRFRKRILFMFADAA